MKHLYYDYIKDRHKKEHFFFDERFKRDINLLLHEFVIKCFLHVIIQKIIIFL